MTFECFYYINSEANRNINMNTSNRLLTITEYIKSIGKDVDPIYLDILWNNSVEDKWIYIGDDILKWIGYQSIDNREMKKYYVQLLKSNFVKYIDYKYLNASEMKQLRVSIDQYNNNKEFPKPKLYCAVPDNINEHNKAKHLMVAPDCFKESIMRMNTDRSTEIRKCYITYENIFKTYLEYCNTFNETRINLAHQTIKNNQTIIKANTNITLLENTGYVYIATSKYNAEQMIFKVGKTTKKLKIRLVGYNTAATNDNQTYFCRAVACHNPDTLERNLHTALKPFQHRSELYQIQYQSHLLG